MLLVSLEWGYVAQIKSGRIEPSKDHAAGWFENLRAGERRPTGSAEDYAGRVEPERFHQNGLSGECRPPERPAGGDGKQKGRRPRGLIFEVMLFLFVCRPMNTSGWTPSCRRPRLRSWSWRGTITSCRINWRCSRRLGINRRRRRVPIRFGRRWTH